MKGVTSFTSRSLDTFIPPCIHKNKGKAATFGFAIPVKTFREYTFSLVVKSWTGIWNQAPRIYRIKHGFTSVYETIRGTLFLCDL